MKVHAKASGVGTRTKFPKRSSTGCSVMQCVLYIQPQGHEIVIIYHNDKVASPMTLAWTLTRTQTSSLVSLSSSTSSHSTPSCWAMYSHVTFSPPEKHKQQKKKKRKKEKKIGFLLYCRFVLCLHPRETMLWTWIRLVRAQWREEKRKHDGNHFITAERWAKNMLNTAKLANSSHPGVT